MSSNESRLDYTVAQKVVHWLLAMLLLIDLTVAQAFGGQLPLAERLQNREGHAAVGTIILTLLIIRIILRLRNGAPAFPETMPAWQKMAASFTHIGFYVLLAFIVVSGMFTADYATNPLNWFGVFDIAIMGNTSEKAFHSVRLWHELATKILIVMIVIHVLAAFYHGLVAKDGRLTRMLMFWKRAS